MFLFFKQKTAYEMRISDWSSDVCSSDLGAGSMKFQKILWLSFGVVTAGSLAACSGVGNGSKPDHLEISQTQGLLGINSNKSFVCFPEPLTLSIVFDNGRYERIGRAQVCTPVTNSHLVCRHML